MQPDLRTNDVQLTPGDVGRLENAGQVVHFFHRLGYNVDPARSLTHAALGMDTEELRHLIHEIRLVATDPEEEEIRVYLMEVRSVTVRLVNTIARRFRERPESALLVLTSDYETLDFVLLERSVEKSKSAFKPFKQLIRPRTLTVNRRNPGPVALRVLRRFTYSEGDPFFQWEKLLSAFTLAEWSEQYFNNRALFSDYYLKNRLADPQITPAWGEDVLPIGRELFPLLGDVRQKYSNEPESTMRRGLYEPLFERLGFAWKKNKAGASAAEEPDYYLYAPDDVSPDDDGAPVAKPRQPRAAVLTYVWNRNLDMTDEKRDPHTPDEIPGALVVSVLERGRGSGESPEAVPWVIVTNGKLWRLYAAEADNKATNYYEVDLEEALAAEDQVTALKYWWLFFRREAFEGMLDGVLQASQDYARALGERLKDRVFEEIFPHFAAGFMAYRWRQRGDGERGMQTAAAQRGMETASTHVATEATFEATLTFLYRLMFLLYAESLELLPVYEKRGYRPHSLYRLKKAVADVAGTIEDEAPHKIEAHYSDTSTDLYEQLQELFRAVNEGSEEWNLPVYNGGLFSPHTDEGQFLESKAIPDRHLALGLDRLARDVDEKTQALAMIDYKDLGVRHLGSIYEGLLEFKLRVAPEKLAVVRQKGRDVYMPLAEA